ncbi:MAG: ATP-binding cassette domain-containing protein [Acidimicrobiales bacterium]|jgi:putative ABC transport system ATP-binding protein
MTTGGATTTGGTARYAARGVDLVKVYRTRASVVRALDRVDIDVPTGTIVAVFGPSGSGKSSLARILAAIDLPDGGELSIDGANAGQLRPKARRKLRSGKIGYVFADPAHNLLPYLDSVEHIELALRMRGAKARSDHKLRALESLGLGHRLHHRPFMLSGGEQQRLAVACAIAGAPSIVVLDEPTAELDRSSGTVLLEHVTNLRSEGTTFVISSHDRAVAEIADEVVELRRGTRVR